MLLMMPAVEVTTMSKDRKYPSAAEVLLDAQLPSVNAIKDNLMLTTDELAAAADRSVRSTARWLAAEETTPVQGPAARALRGLAHID
jgi:hypothetical protein